MFCELKNYGFVVLAHLTLLRDFCYNHLIDRMIGLCLIPSKIRLVLR